MTFFIREYNNNSVPIKEINALTIFHKKRYKIKQKIVSLQPLYFWLYLPQI